MLVVHHPEKIPPFPGAKSMTIGSFDGVHLGHQHRINIQRADVGKREQLLSLLSPITLPKFSIALSLSFPRSITNCSCSKNMESISSFCSDLPLALQKLPTMISSAESIIISLFKRLFKERGTNLEKEDKEARCK